MVDATPFLPGLSPVQGKAVVARFDGGRLQPRRHSPEAGRSMGKAPPWRLLDAILLCHS
jgi:hypothetical protein